MSTHANMVKMGVTSVASAGTGTITLGAASSGYRHINAAITASATVDILITEGTSWEVARNCAYTYNATPTSCTIDRGTLESSSTGSAVVFTAAATVSVVATADYGNRLERAMQGITPGGRLTLESGAPIQTADQSAKTTLYYTPFVSNVIPLWDGSAWVPTTFAETSEVGPTLTAALPYDVYGFLSSGVLDLELLAWTDATTRATTPSLQDGRYCKGSGADKTRLLLGTIVASATNQMSVDQTIIGVANLYNQVEQVAYYAAGSSNHTYATSTSMREYNGTTDTALIRVASVLGGSSFIKAGAIMQSSSASLCQLWAQRDTSTTPDGTKGFAVSTLGANSWGLTGTDAIPLIPGLNKIYLAERNVSAATITADFGTLRVKVLA